MKMASASLLPRIVSCQKQQNYVCGVVQAGRTEGCKHRQDQLVPGFELQARVQETDDASNFLLGCPTMLLTTALHP